MFERVAERLKSMFTPRAKDRFERHTNPDGKLGGEVSTRAKVHPTAFVDPSAIVMAGAVIGAKSRVEAGNIVLPGSSVARLDGR